MNIEATRENMTYEFDDDPIPFKVVSFLWDALPLKVKVGIIYDGQVGETWPGMDYALWYAAHNGLHVPDTLLDEVEEEMNRTQDFCGLVSSLSTLRAANIQVA